MCCNFTDSHQDRIRPEGLTDGSSPKRQSSGENSPGSWLKSKAFQAWVVCVLWPLFSVGTLALLMNLMTKSDSSHWSMALLMLGLYGMTVVEMWCGLLFGNLMVQLGSNLGSKSSPLRVIVVEALKTTWHQFVRE